MNTSKIDFLTPKQQLFCDEYLVDMNATAAALRAGYSATTALNGSLMKLPKIKTFIEQQVQSKRAKTEAIREVLIAELMKVATVSLGDYFDENGVKPIHLLTPEEKSALWYVKQNADGSVVYKTHNKLAAIEKLNKMLLLYLPEVKEPATEYVYIDKKSLNEDDRFEDDTVDQPEIPFEQPLSFADAEGNTIYEGPIPYGPMSDVFAFDMKDKPTDMLDKLKLYEDLQPEVIERALSKGVVLERVEIRLLLSAWLSKELADCDCVMNGESYEEVFHMFRGLRGLRKATKVKVAA